MPRVSRCISYPVQVNHRIPHQVGRGRVVPRPVHLTVCCFLPDVLLTPFLPESANIRGPTWLLRRGDGSNLVDARVCHGTSIWLTSRYRMHQQEHPLAHPATLSELSA